ncbi:MAG: hypothetical protein U9Q61_05405 [Thermodesulfobacteriota bacterium]|nr:hypothetical protein [Thermodesulfobacteriota bacterium]
MMVILSAPLSLLCFHLAWLCYRKECPKPAWVSLTFAVILLLVSVVTVCGSFYAWDAIQGEISSL